MRNSRDARRVSAVVWMAAALVALTGVSACAQSAESMVATEASTGAPELTTPTVSGPEGTEPSESPAGTSVPEPPPTDPPVLTVAPPAPTPSTSPPTSRPATSAPPAPAPTDPPAPPPQPADPLPAGDTSVFVLGDSVLLGTTSTLPAALTGWTVTMDCSGSRRLVQDIPVLQARRGEIGRVLVIQAGNNYIPGEGGSFASQIDEAMSAVSGVDRVVWVTVAENVPSGSSRVMINGEIRSAATRWPSIVIADWASVIAANPGYAGDALHLSPSGRVAMADLIAAAVGPVPV